MNVVCVSDLHGYLPDIPECDLLIVAGDVTPIWDHKLDFQAKWLRDDFSPWLGEVPATEVVWIGGNHDFVLEDWRHKRFQIDSLGGFYLDNEDITTMGLKIYGSPMSNRYGDWAHMASEGELSEMWRKIPRDIDILITHGPPYGMGDIAPDKYGFTELRHVGSTSLANQLAYEEWPNLKLHVFGHIHEGYGQYRISDVAGNYHTSINAARMDVDYRPSNPIVKVEL